MTDKIIPQPISRLRQDMGMVLLIGSSGYTTTPTRAEIGYVDERGKLRTCDGETFTSGGDDATSFIEIPYDQQVAKDLANGKTAEQSENLTDMLVTLSGIAFGLADAIGPVRATNQMWIALQDFGEVNSNDGPAEKLINTIRHILDDDDHDREGAEYAIKKIRQMITKYGEDAGLPQAA